jgi:hypothetical protein
MHLQVKYSLFMHGLREENVQLNRKMLAELAMYEPYSFKALVDQVRFMKASGNPADTARGSQLESRTSTNCLGSSSSYGSSTGSQPINNS